MYEIQALITLVIKNINLKLNISMSLCKWLVLIDMIHVVNVSVTTLYKLVIWGNESSIVRCTTNLSMRCLYLRFHWTTYWIHTRTLISPEKESLDITKLNKKLHYLHQKAYAFIFGTPNRFLALAFRTNLLLNDSSKV